MNDGAAGMTDQAFAPEIPWQTSQAIESWRRILSNTAGDKSINFQRASVELLRLADREEQPDMRRAIVDSLYEMARSAGIDDHTAQALMVNGDQAPADQRPINGSAHHAVVNGEQPPLATSPDDYGMSVATIEAREVLLPPAVLTTPAGWPQETPAPISWLAKGRIPHGEVTLFAGDGGSGKTDAALQLAANVARQSSDWFGHEIVPGAVAFISAEECEEEIRRRLYWLGKRDGYGNADLDNLHLWFPADSSGDCVMAVPDRSGIMRPTPLFRSIEAALAIVRPVLVVVDNVAATFAGDQNQRVAARTYVNLWRTIARGPSFPAVLLLDHPSLSGLTSGTGRGGNMDWWNAVRGVLLLRIPDDKAEADSGIRLLETGKSNYAKRGNPLRIQWADGGLQLEHAPSSLHRLAKDAECEEIFLRLLDERNAQGRPVYPGRGHNYAPAVFAEMPSSNGFAAKAFAQGMERLFQGKKISLREVRVDGKPRQCIDRTEPSV
jgi:RecA-family ATPase